LDVVWNAALAPYILGETLTKGRMLGCALIMVGTVMAGCFGNHAEPEYTIDYIEETLLNIRNLVYSLCFLAWFALNRFWLMNFPSGSAVRGVSLGCTAGTIAGNMFCVKGAIELIQRSIHEEDADIWLHWLPYVLLIGAAFFAVSNVGFMTKGLQEYEALFMVTIYEGSMIVSGCISGAVVLLDLKGLEVWRVLLYGLGVLTIVAGMQVIFYLEARSRSSLLSKRASIELDNDVLNTSHRSLHATCDVTVVAEEVEASKVSKSSDEVALEPSAWQPGPPFSERDALEDQQQEAHAQVTVVKAAVSNGLGWGKEAQGDAKPDLEWNEDQQQSVDQSADISTAFESNLDARVPNGHANTSSDLQPIGKATSDISQEDLAEAKTAVVVASEWLADGDTLSGDASADYGNIKAASTSTPKRRQKEERISIHLVGPHCCFPTATSVVPTKRRESTPELLNSSDDTSSSPSRRRQQSKKKTKTGK